MRQTWTKGWEAHTGLDYTVVMLPGECTETASIQVSGRNAESLARLIAKSPEMAELLRKLLLIAKTHTDVCKLKNLKHETVLEVAQQAERLLNELGPR